MLAYILYILIIWGNYNINPINYNKALDEITKHEGLRLKPYTLNGHKYIGYGHLIKKNEHYTSIDSSEARYIMFNDLLCNINTIHKYSNLKGNKLLSVSMLSYNIGSTKVKKYIKNGLLNNYKSILTYNKFKCEGKVISSYKLGKRRAYEYALYNL